MFTSDWGNANEIKSLFDPGAIKSAQSWALDLFCAADDEVKFQKTKAVSPFAGKIVVIADLSSDSQYCGDIETFMHKRGVEIDIASSTIRSVIRNSGHEDNWSKYVVVFGESVEVFYLGKNEKPALRPTALRKE